MTQNDKVAFVLMSTEVGGTQRRIGNLFKFLSDKYPGRYHLIINSELYQILQKGNYQFERYPNIHIIKKKSRFDLKSGAHSGPIINLGRIFTLFYYRKEVERIIKDHNISTIQVFLEMVPFLGVYPIKKVRTIASLVSHLPKYYDKSNFNCKSLLYALGNYDSIDALYEYIGGKLIELGVSYEKINYPHRNFVNHIQFKPDKKERIITFSARLVDFKNPLLFLDAVLTTLPNIEEDIVFYILGKGPLLHQIQDRIKVTGLGDRIKAMFSYDPSTIVNKSMIHLSIEEYDNFTNQSLLEGMASGCAIISVNVGLTTEVVTKDIGVTVEMTAKEISDAIIRLLQEPGLIEQMGLESRKKILNEFNISTYLDYITKAHDFNPSFHIINGKEIPK